MPSGRCCRQEAVVVPVSDTSMAAIVGCQVRQTMAVRRWRPCDGATRAVSGHEGPSSGCEAQALRRSRAQGRRSGSDVDTRGSCPREGEAGPCLSTVERRWRPVGRWLSPGRAQPAGSGDLPHGRPLLEVDVSDGQSARRGPARVPIGPGRRHRTLFRDHYASLVRVAYCLLGHRAASRGRGPEAFVSLPPPLGRPEGQGGRRRLPPEGDRQPVPHGAAPADPRAWRPGAARPA